MANSVIKNIIFDLGGVILNIDTQLTLNAFINLGLNNPFEEKNTTIELFYNLEKGISSPGAFHDNFRKLTGLNTPDDEIDAAWTAMILDIPADRIKYIEELKRKYRIFLLSNTNEIHRLKFHRAFEEDFGYPFDQVFERNHYSHEMGLRKPDPGIYLKVLTENNLIAAETLFIDDVEENVIASESVGINGLHIQPGRLLEILPPYLSGFSK